jgi:hypothetical protein
MEGLCYCPDINTPGKKVVSMFKNMPPLRTFRYNGTCNVRVVGPLSEHCRKIEVLSIPQVELGAALLELSMQRLTALRDLCIIIRPTQEGSQLTHIIGQSKTLVSLSLKSSGARTVKTGLLEPIALGQPCPTRRPRAPWGL